MSPEGQLGLWSSCSPHGEPWSALSSRQTAKGAAFSEALAPETLKDGQNWANLKEA